MSFANPILIECIMADDDGGSDNNDNYNEMLMISAPQILSRQMK